MLTKTRSAAVQGIQALPVEVEVNVSGSGPETQVVIVGLPDTAVRESRQRVWSALAASGMSPPSGLVTINLAPGDLQKSGAAYDLPIAVGVAACDRQVDPASLASTMMLGELALDGRLRPLRGILPMALLAKEQGMESVFVPEENAEEAALVGGLKVFGMKTLYQAMQVVTGELAATPVSVDFQSLLMGQYAALPDLADVRGQRGARRALEIAAAGGHNLLFVGPPGSGKTLLAQRLPSILPPLSMEEALETTRIHSIAGLLSADAPLVGHRPFRAPHHTVSDAGLLGGHTVPRPGEISLAHHGVLFLDELPEYPRHVLEALRQPLESGTIVVSRASGSVTFPASFMLVAAMNPCPCGYYGSTRKACRCSTGQILKYRSRLSGPLLDRLDLHVEVAALSDEELLRQGKRGEESGTVRERVLAARQIQLRRYQGTSVRCNALLHGRGLDEHCRLDDDSRRLLQMAIQDYGLSARSCDRILRVARTIADLAGAETIVQDMLYEAVQYRVLDKKYW